MKKQAVASSDAPSALGPYSQAIAFGDLLFCSGQIALDPASGTIVGENVETQTEQVMKNLAAVLKARKLDFSHVLKTTVFLKNMGDFAKFNEVYARFLSAPFPARATIEVARLPKDVLVEIECVAGSPE